MIWGKFRFLAAILFFKILSKFVHIVHTNFHTKSGVGSSKNERVMTLGKKEDKHLTIIYIQVIIQSKLHFSYSRRKCKKCKKCKMYKKYKSTKKTLRRQLLVQKAEKSKTEKYKNKKRKICK